MTNTVLYYYDTAAGPMGFVSSSGDSQGIVPTIVRAVAGLKRTFIGSAAQERESDEVIAHSFKLDLPSSGQNSKERNANPSFQAARRFLQQLHLEFTEKSRNFIERVTLAVPETWIVDPNQAGMDALRQILHDLKLPQPNFVSESVAAACYFAHKHLRENNRAFDGYAFVYDHGGGTLDLSFVRIQGSRITRLEGDGLGSETSQLGFGGVAFDRAVFERCAVSNPKLAGLSDNDRVRWLESFEVAKRKAGPLFREAYEDYLRDPYGEAQYIKDIRDEAGGKTRITSRDLIDPFATSFAPHIRERLERFVRHCASRFPDADLEDGSNLRVLLVGGFSEFYPVAHCVRAFFRSQYGSSDAVFADHLNQNERWTSTARGACLVAGGNIEIEERCPFSCGIVTYSTDGASRYNILVDQTKSISHYASLEPRFLGERFRLFSRETSLSTPLVVYVERSGSVREYPIQHALADILPDQQSALYWDVGVRINRGKVSITFKSNLGHRRSLDLGEFIQISEGEFGHVVVES